MKSKLDELLDDDETFAVDAISHDVGMMFNEHDDAVDYVILEYADRFDAYLNLYDEGEAPIRNILVKGSSKSREVAISIANRKLNNEYQKKIVKNFHCEAFFSVPCIGEYSVVKVHYRLGSRNC